VGTGDNGNTDCVPAHLYARSAAVSSISELHPEIKNRWAVKSGNGHKNRWDQSKSVAHETIVALYLSRPKFFKHLFRCCSAADWCCLLRLWSTRYLFTNPDHRQQLCRVLPRPASTRQSRQAAWGSGTRPP